MELISLQSGSNGNCYFIRGHRTSIVIDAGISGKRAQERLAEFGHDLAGASGLVISHDHTDHAGCAGVFHRKFSLPIYASRKTYTAMRHKIGKVDSYHPFAPHEPFTVGEFSILPILTPHDAAEACGLIIRQGDKSIGIFTDLGCVFDGLGEAIASVDAVVLECNYCPRMLQQGGYPYHLKQRITSDRGHISNTQCAEILATFGRHLKWVALGHLSGENNTPSHALSIVAQRLGDAIPLTLLSRHQAVGGMEV